MGLSNDAMNRFGALAVLPLLVGGAVLASCSSESTGAAGPAVLEGSGVIALVNAPADAGDGALLEGVLSLGPGGCAGVTHSYGTSPTHVLVIWPSGTGLLPDGAGLDVPGLGALEVGDAVALGGGFPMTPRSVPPLIPDVCEVDGEYFAAWTAVT